MSEEIGRGAEAIIYREGETIRKYRPPKTYRHKDLDRQIRKQRTRKEAKILRDLEQLKVPAPRLISMDDQEGTIIMSHLKGEKLRDVLEENLPLCKEVGKHLATLHNHNIIHGDLTTSNIIINEENTVQLIDFGLSTHSTRIEDRAVDLHLFKQALESKHHTIAEKAWKLFLEGYQPQERTNILERLRVVEKRGRNKHE